MLRLIGSVAALSLLVAAGCSKPGDGPSPAAHAAPPAAATTAAPTAPDAAAVTSPSGVTRVVFVDKKNCCDCTQTRQENTWAALQGALETVPGLPVQRIHMDTQKDQAEPYRLMKALMVPPGLYFIDAKHELVDMLQGELSKEQIVVVLTKKRSS